MGKPGATYIFVGVVVVALGLLGFGATALFHAAQIRPSVVRVCDYQQDWVCTLHDFQGVAVFFAAVLTSVAVIAAAVWNARAVRLASLRQVDVTLKALRHAEEQAREDAKREVYRKRLEIAGALHAEVNVFHKDFENQEFSQNIETSRDVAVSNLM